MRTNYDNIEYIQHRMFCVTSTMIKCSCRCYFHAIEADRLQIINNKTENKEEKLYEFT